MLLQFFSQHWKTILLILAILFVLLDILVMYACVVVGARSERQMEEEWERYCQEHPEAQGKEA